MRLFLMLALLATASQSGAEITIRSGEHETFSRLVFTSPTELDWLVTSENRTVSIRVNDKAQTFNTSAVFDRIPRTRISSIRKTGNGGITFDLNCNCEVSTFQFGQQSFVVDVIDQVNTALNSEVDTRPQARKPPPTLPLFPSTAITHTFMLPTVARKLAPHADNAAKEMSSAVPNVAVNDLSQALGAAITQNLLDPAQFATKNQKALKRPALAKIEKNTKSSVNTRNINTDTALKRPSQKNSLSKNDICKSIPSIEVNSWAPGRGFMHSIGDLRKRLYYDSGGLNADTAKELAKLYIYYGFGAEATSVIRNIEQKTSSLKKIQSLSLIIEHLEDLNSPFQGMHRCENDNAMWSTLASKRGEKLPDANTKAIVRTFIALPPHLKKHLGVDLSQALRLAGHESAGRQVLEAKEKLRGLTNQRAFVEVSKYNSNNQISELLIDELEDSILRGKIRNTEAISLILSHAVEKNEPTSKIILELSETFLDPSHIDSQNTDILVSHIIASIASGKIRDAIHTTSKHRAKLSDAQLGSISTILSQYLLDTTNDGEFLVYLTHATTDNFPWRDLDVKALRKRINSLSLGSAAAEIFFDSSDQVGDEGADETTLAHKASISPRRQPSDIGTESVSSPLASGPIDSLQSMSPENQRSRSKGNSNHGLITKANDALDQAKSRTIRILEVLNASR